MKWMWTVPRHVRASWSMQLDKASSFCSTFSRSVQVVSQAALFSVSSICKRITRVKHQHWRDRRDLKNNWKTCTACEKNNKKNTEHRFVRLFIYWIFIKCNSLNRSEHISACRTCRLVPIKELQASCSKTDIQRARTQATNTCFSTAECKTGL